MRKTTTKVTVHASEPGQTADLIDTVDATLIESTVGSFVSLDVDDVAFFLEPDLAADLAVAIFRAVSRAT